MGCTRMADDTIRAAISAIGTGIKEGLYTRICDGIGFIKKHGITYTTNNDGNMAKMNYVLLMITLCAILCAYIWKSIVQKKGIHAKKVRVYPGALPIIGHGHLLMKFGGMKKFHQWLNAIMSEENPGSDGEKCVMIYLPGLPTAKPVVLVWGMDDSKQILQNRPFMFDRAKDMTSSLRLRFGGERYLQTSEGLFSSNGLLKWGRQRRVTASCFSALNIAKMCPMISIHVSNIVNK